MADAEDWDAFTSAVDNTFFARLLVEPSQLLDGFAAVPGAWLQQNPRYLMAGAIAEAATTPYALIPAPVVDRFAEWVSEQDVPAARDLLGIMQTKLRSLNAAGRIAEADEEAEASLRLIAGSRDTDGFDDVLPPVFIRIGMIKLLRGNVRDAIGIFAEGARRAEATGHPCAPHVSNFAALAYALLGNFTQAEEALHKAPTPSEPTGPMHAFYCSTAEYAATLIALGKFEPIELTFKEHEFGSGEFWWISCHIRAKAALTGSDRSAAAAALEDVLDHRRDLTGPGTLAGSTLRVDLANLYMALQNYQAASHVLRDQPATNTHEAVWAAQARLALLTGQAERALNIVSGEQRIHGGRHRTAPGLLVTKAAAQRILGDTSSALESIERAAEAVLRTSAFHEVVEAHPIVRIELADKVQFRRELPDEIYSMTEFIRLTRREREVLNVLEQHRSVKEIAGALHVSPHTAKSHLASLYKKLGVHSHEQALRVADAWRVN
ncbi:LuxR family transcriptional regulator [Agreia pratensis]|uniref:helix-turn-helix transcriptional regulator n=1 Tax=Agreia pratensis TaxID=150121 RepID=UPI00188BB21F|nr:LuxR C-terminal-related transcriptional regulator [Agreia pratensis]MBF4636190.1 LuxR family transcriptional regulator [Agreia pratensis]